MFTSEFINYTALKVTRKTVFEIEKLFLKKQLWKQNEIVQGFKTEQVT